MKRNLTGLCLVLEIASIAVLHTYKLSMLKKETIKPILENTDASLKFSGDINEPDAAFVYILNQ